jgi:hypothetical protein
MFWDMKYPMTIATSAMTRRIMIIVPAIYQRYIINLTPPKKGGKIIYHPPLLLGGLEFLIDTHRDKEVVG